MKDGKIDVLYVDDDKTLLEVVSIYLETNDDLSVETANSAEEAIEILKKRKFDVIVSDYQMPIMDGIQFLKYVNSNFLTKPPFIIFTGKSREEVAIEALNNEAAFYVQKGHDIKSQFAELSNAIRRASLQNKLENKFRIIHELTMELMKKSNTQKENLEIIIKGVLNVLQTDAAAIFLKDKSDGHLRPYVLKGFVTEEFGKMVVKSEKGLGGLILKNKQGFVVNDYVNCRDISHDLDEFIVNENLVSLMGVPIISDDIDLGVLYVGLRRQRKFNQEDLNTLSLFGNIAAMAIVRKRREERIIEERNRYIEFIDSLNQVVFETDTEGRIALINDFGINQLGYSQKDIIGQHVCGLIHPGQRDEAASILKDVFTSDVSRRERSYQIMKRDGTFFPGLISYSSIGRGKGIRGLIFDNTQQEKLNQQIIAINKKLQLMNNIIRHDMNNYLSVVNCRIDMIKEDDESGIHQEAIAVIKGRLEKIENALLSAKLYQEIGVKSPEWISLEEIFNNCVNNFPEIKFENCAKRVKVLADPLFRRAVYNLVDNTIRHGRGATKIMISYWLDEEGLTIVYEDDGVGVPNGQKEEIFEYGYGQNTGLGLFLIREIFNITGIEIKEVGEFGKGVRFEILISEENYLIR